jgi:formylglycine-generating enzyme required for sulfatase activity
MRSRHLALVALLAVVAPAAASAAVGARPGRRPAAVANGMVRIPSGEYRPLYAVPGAQRVRIAGFALDRRPVSRADFLAFVRQHPEWRRGQVRPLFAESAYLAEWPGMLDAGRGADAQRPVTGVSWFAAKAYCAAQDKRLPTLDEWEYAAAASESRRDASADPAFRRRLLALYAARSSGRLPIAGSGAANVYGVRDLHGSAWEWTLDFNSVVVADDSRVSGSGQDARDHRLFCASAAIGATDPANYPAFVRFAVRAGLTARATLGGLGFRCAADLPL